MSEFMDLSKPTTRALDTYAREGEVTLVPVRRAKRFSPLGERYVVVTSPGLTVLLERTPSGARVAHALPKGGGAELRVTKDGRAFASSDGDDNWLVFGVKSGRMKHLGRAKGSLSFPELEEKLAAFDGLADFTKATKALAKKAGAHFGWVAAELPSPPPPPRSHGCEVVLVGGGWEVAIGGRVPVLDDAVCGRDVPWDREFWLRNSAHAVTEGDRAWLATPSQRLFEIDLATGEGVKIVDTWREPHFASAHVVGLFRAEGTLAVVTQGKVLFVRGRSVVAGEHLGSDGAYGVEGASDAVLLGHLLLVATSSYERPGARIHAFCMKHGGARWLDFLDLPLFQPSFSVVGGRLFAHDARGCLELQGLEQGLAYFNTVFCGKRHRDDVPYSPDWKRWSLKG